MARPMASATMLYRVRLALIPKAPLCWKSVWSGYQQKPTESERYHLEMKIDLSGRTAVITGGSRGLGEAMANSLSQAGAQVALVARDVERLKSVRDAIVAAGGAADYFTADVTSETDVAALAQAVTKRFGPAQILINNAGINIRKQVVEYTLEEFQSV